MNNDELMHYGVLGMKWGVRRYRNADGSLTELGKKKSKRYEKRLDKIQQKQVKMENGSKTNLKKIYPKIVTKINKKYSKMSNKMYLQDFTMKKLRDIQKHSDQLDKRTIKFFNQEKTKMLLSTNVKDVPTLETIRKINEREHQQFQNRTNTQIQRQIQQTNLRTLGMM